MNILQIQDKLKDLSDQQLVSEMTNPTGSAPQFLVLSEMKRRKEMRARASTPQAPQGSMADEAVQDGIAALAQEPSSYDLDDQAEAEEMAAGGIVRLFGGGSTDPRAIQRNLEDQVLEAELADIVRRQTSQTDRAPLISNAMRDVRALIDSGMSDEAALQETLRSTAFRGRVSREDLAPAFNVRRSTAPAGGRSFTEETPIAPAPPGLFPDGPISESDPVRGADPFVAAPRTTTIPRDASRPTGAQGSASPPAARPTGTAGASGTAGTSVAPAAASASGIGSLPQSRGYAAILDEIEQRNGTGGRLDELARQMERTDPAARRADATNLALLEAGLRIAGSNNPNAIGALSEGAGALPGYARQLSEIRKDQRDDILTQIQMERARAEDSRSARALAANLYGTESQREIARENNIAALERTRMSNAASIAAATAGRVTPEMYLNATPEQRTLYDRMLGRDRTLTWEEYSRMTPEQQAQARSFLGRDQRRVSWEEYQNMTPDQQRSYREFTAAQDPTGLAVRQANADAARVRNIEDATRRFRDANPGFVPNLPEENIARMRPEAQQRYRALQSEFNRIQRGELPGGGGAFNYVPGQGAVPAGGR